MHVPLIQREGFILRPWDRTDATALVKHANNPRVAAQLRDGFALKAIHRKAVMKGGLLKDQWSG